MAVERPFPRRRAGTITLVALCLTSALGVAVGSYLALFARARDLGVRQLHREQADELAQTGLEEALWALNYDNWAESGPGNATAWTTSGANRTVTLDYPDLGHGTDGRIAPTVEDFASAGPTWPVIAVEATLSPLAAAPVVRRLRAQTAPAPLFGNAIASAEGSVTFAAGGTIDSWDSDPDDNPATAPVPYAFTAADPNNHGAIVAGRDDGTNGVVLTQATVRGYVATFGQPVSYSVSAVPPARVIGSDSPAGTTVDTARLSRSAFVPVAPVFAINLPPTTGPAYGGLVGDVLALADALLGAPPEAEVYRVNGDLTILGIPLISPSLTVDRPLKLIIDGSLTISGAGKITINPGASLQVFVGGDCTLGGEGIDNRNVAPATCIIFATNPSTTDTLQYTTARDFRGVIYCENKPIDIRENATFFGALLSRRQVTFSASATAPVFHYDLALRMTRLPHISTPYILARIAVP